MKKKILLFVASIAMILSSCNNDDNGSTITYSNNTIVGSWKLIEKYENNEFVSLNNCELQETYIFGPQQYSHETFSGSASGRISTNNYVTYGDDDDDHDDDDDDDDHHSSDDDDDDDDDHGNSGNCISQGVTIGNWSTPSGSLYHLSQTGTGEINIMNIYFTNNNNRFYYEVTEMINGRVITTKYVFQKQ